MARFLRIFISSLIYTAVGATICYLLAWAASILFFIVLIVVIVIAYLLSIAGINISVVIVSVFGFYISTREPIYLAIENNLQTSIIVVLAITFILIFLIHFLNDDDDDALEYIYIFFLIASLIIALLIFPFVIEQVFGGIIISSLPPTATQTASPTPTLIPSPTPTPVAIFSSTTLTTQIQPDGTVKNVSQLSLNSLGFGEVTLSYPKEINIHDSALVRLSIDPDSSIVSFLTVVTTSVSATQTPITFTDRIEIYPVMQADLYGVGFDITSEENSLKVITSDRPAEWTWSIKPKQSGSQSLVIRITVPVKVDGSDQNLDHLLKNISANIEVRKTVSDWTNELIPIVTPTLLAALLGAFGFYFKREVEKEYEKEITRRDNEHKHVQEEKQKLEENYKQEREKILEEREKILEEYENLQFRREVEIASLKTQLETSKILADSRLQELETKNAADKSKIDIGITALDSHKITKQQILWKILMRRRK